MSTTAPLFTISGDASASSPLEAVRILVTDSSDEPVEVAAGGGESFTAGIEWGEVDGVSGIAMGLSPDDPDTTGAMSMSLSMSVAVAD